jgi:hypothetical protein
MGNKLIGLFCGVLAATLSPGSYAADENMCRAQTSAAQQCRWISGTITASNGTPSIRIKPQGGHRTLGVWPPEEEWMPDEIKQKLNFDNKIQARIRICPVSKKGDAGMALVCIDEARDIRVSKR